MKRVSVEDDVCRKALFKLHGIREFKVVLDRVKCRSTCVHKKKLLSTINKEDDVCRKVLFKLHGIREFKVVLDRVKCGSTCVHKKKLLSTVIKGSVRSQVIWLPTVPSTNQNVSVREVPSSSMKRASTSKKETSPEVLPAKCDRLQSLSKQHTTAKKPTNEDFHSELLSKFNSPNRALRPANERNLAPVPVSKNIPEFQKIFDEFKLKLSERKNK